MVARPHAAAHKGRHDRATDRARPLRLPARAQGQQRAALVRGEQGALPGGGAGPHARLHRGLRRAPRRDQPAFPRRPAAERRLALPHLPRHPLLQGQDALQDQCRRPLPPRRRQGRPCARLLPPSGAGDVLRRLRRLAPGRRRPRPHSRRHRRTARRVDPRHHGRGFLPHLPAGGRSAQAPAARLRPRTTP